jgi:hypothetical protein
LRFLGDQPLFGHTQAAPCKPLGKARRTAMSEDYRIYVDGERPATLNNGAGVLTDHATLQEAVLAWRGLPPGQKLRATVKVVGGPVYTAHDIDRLYYGPKPA